MKDLIDGEVRHTYFLRGDDMVSDTRVLARPELWVAAKLLGFKQWGIDGRVRTGRVTFSVMWFADRNAVVEVVDISPETVREMLRLQ
jgi:hypothetical protein